MQFATSSHPSARLTMSTFAVVYVENSGYNLEKC